MEVGRGHFCVEESEMEVDLAWEAELVEQVSVVSFPLPLNGTAWTYSCYLECADPSSSIKQAGALLSIRGKLVLMSRRLLSD